MAIGWFIFGVVMPAVVAAGGWMIALSNDRYLRKQRERRAEPAE